MRKLVRLALVAIFAASALTLASTSSAQAGGKHSHSSVFLGFNYYGGGPYYPYYGPYYYRPYYYPYYYAPPPVAYAPPPVVYSAPPVVVTQPAPMTATATSPSYTASNGQTCREFQSTATIGGQQQPIYGTACLQPDGAWRVVR